MACYQAHKRSAVRAGTWAPKRQTGTTCLDCGSAEKLKALGLCLRCYNRINQRNHRARKRTVIPT